MVTLFTVVYFGVVVDSLKKNLFRPPVNIHWILFVTLHIRCSFEENYVLLAFLCMLRYVTRTCHCKPRPIKLLYQLAVNKANNFSSCMSLIYNVTLQKRNVKSADAAN